MTLSAIDKARNTSLAMLRDAGITLAEDEAIEVTDFGQGDYDKLGLGLITRINEPEYGSSWLTVQPGQTCPNHYHEFVKESFLIFRGDVTIWIDDEVVEMEQGDKVTMKEGTWHKFTSTNGAVIEEITTTVEEITADQLADDSIFEDKRIERYVTIEDR